MMKAIIDCNSFYCSCERLFKPHLDHKPVVVLSNNDGCIVSRTDEAKALGIAMAIPYFMAKEMMIKNKVAAFSSNYHLYGDMSWRVMETLRKIAGEENVEVYSVDEAFVDLTHLGEKDLREAGLMIRTVVEQWTGIKVSVGIAPTKVLCKIANHIAKKHKIETECVVVLDSEDKIRQALQDTPVNEVWGVGRKYAEKLVDMHAIYTAFDLSKKTNEWAHTVLGGVVGVRLLKELNGEPCIVMKDELINKKMIATTRMFGQPVTKLSEIKEAVAVYTSTAAEKLRRQGSAADTISVFVVAKGQDHNISFHGESHSLSDKLSTATSATNELIKAAVKLAEKLFRQGTQYKKAGVMLSGIVPDANIQANLFSGAEKKNNRMLMSAVDNVNFAMRNDLVRFAAGGNKRDWKMRMELRSPRYTTRWEEMFEVR